MNRRIEGTASHPPDCGGMECVRSFIELGLASSSKRALSWHNARLCCFSAQLTKRKQNRSSLPNVHGLLALHCFSLGLSCVLFVLAFSHLAADLWVSCKRVWISADLSVSETIWRSGCTAWHPDRKSMAGFVWRINSCLRFSFYLLYKHLHVRNFSTSAWYFQ